MLSARPKPKRFLCNSARRQWSMSRKPVAPRSGSAKQQENSGSASPDVRRPGHFHSATRRAAAATPAAQGPLWSPRRAWLAFELDDISLEAAQLEVRRRSASAGIARINVKASERRFGAAAPIIDPIHGHSFPAQAGAARAQNIPLKFSGFATSASSSATARLTRFSCMCTSDCAVSSPK